MAERESFSDGEASEDPLDSPGRHSAGSQHSFVINHTDSAESVNVNHVHSELQRVIPKVAESIAEMEVTNPEVLRVAPAFSAFQNLAVALRVGCDGDFYYKSQKSEKISTFWSHSWHGGQWKKILTLLTFYNGPAAILFAFVIATLMMILFVSGYLPSLDRGFWELYFSVWCLPCGFVVATMVMLLWRSQTKVFLDRICISQQDQDLKAQAIFSLAGLLKNSDVMLILWDPTWTERLWCLFELAAFLKSKKTSSRKQTLIVRPIFLGPISIAVFVFCTAVCLPFLTVSFDNAVEGLLGVVVPAALVASFAAYPAVATARNYFQQLNIMKQQLLAISFDTTRSSCCDQNHKSPSGQSMLCDREVVKECVNIWFGSQEAFEETVRSEVLEILTINLSERVFTTTWVLAVSSPFIWTFMDLSASVWNIPWDASLLTHHSFGFMIEALAAWLVALPKFKDVSIMLCRVTHAKHKVWYIEILKNLLVMSIMAVLISIFLALYVLTRFFTIYASWVWSGSMVVYALLLHLLARGMKIFMTQSGW